MKKALLALGIVAVVIGGGLLWRGVGSSRDTFVKKEYKEPEATEEWDDRLWDQNPIFDEKLVDSRPLEQWLVNQSAAVIALDCPAINPEETPELLELRATYAEVVKLAKGKEDAWHKSPPILPSANLLDGAAKQFDDGLYAALDLACYRGELGDTMPGAVGFVRELFKKLPEGSPAISFLAAALQLAGQSPEADRKTAKAIKRFLAEFERDTAQSKPISFYTWTPELERVWKFFRFLQQEFPNVAHPHLEIHEALAAVLEADADLLQQYQALQGFYGRLTNPRLCLPVDALIGITGAADLVELAQQQGVRHRSVALFPSSTSRETELFERVFTEGVPPNIEVMAELIRRIRSGEVDLTPKPEDGWYQYQVHALECLLSPSKAQEKDKLLLTAKYKKRLVEAFKITITKRRETHARQFPPVPAAKSAAPPPPPHGIGPRLRIEPCPTVYLRTARAYAFVQGFLRTTISQDRLNSLHGLRDGGVREPNLDEELDTIRQRFYGFYLVACEDIGMRPQLLENELVDQDAAQQAALSWIEQIPTNPDLACDTRVAVPIYTMPGTVRLWVTLGVRLAFLNASYARPPKIRPQQQEAPWQEVARDDLRAAKSVIPIDEFAEVEVRTDKIPNRAELRELCDRYKTKDAIVKALADR